MNKTPKRNPQLDQAGMRPEYEFDYSRAKPNRFAGHMKRPVIAVVLEPDVASVFDSASKVNAQLRSVMSTHAQQKQPSRVRGHRRKTG